ncbi:hypothetical protein AVEN_78311-1 [Araneus ventricosus]|uniref:Uncharacterized protein n=1 Tax=Araneus ventricosus TaxID=182803 RepID=A0A4Y2II92_ARAVE|nr:hypothetical protein AVEN_78311-1 [Araneus ventricosus]
MICFNPSPECVPNMLNRVQTVGDSRSLQADDILFFKTFVRDGSMVRKALSILKDKICAHCTSEQTNKLLQKDIPINVVWLRVGHKDLFQNPG